MWGERGREGGGKGRGRGGEQKGRRRGGGREEGRGRGHRPSHHHHTRECHPHHRQEGPTPVWGRGMREDERGMKDDERDEGALFGGVIKLHDRNPADRDHCIQYMTAIALLYGNLTAEHYEDEFALHHLGDIDALRAKMHCVENTQFSRDYLDPEKRSIANTLQIEFADGTKTDSVTVEFPIGHRRRRAEAMPVLEKKFVSGLGKRFGKKQIAEISRVAFNHKLFASTSVISFVEAFVL